MASVVIARNHPVRQDVVDNIKLKAKSWKPKEVE